MSAPTPTLTTPATEIEKAHVLDLVNRHLGPGSALILRRILFELDRLKEKS